MNFQEKQARFSKNLSYKRSQNFAVTKPKKTFSSQPQKGGGLGGGGGGAEETMHPIENFGESEFKLVY